MHPPSARYNFSGTLALRFEADYSSLIHFASADCTVETEVMEEKIVEVPANTTEGDTKEAADGGSKKGDKKGSKWGWKGKGDKKGDKKQAEAEEDKAAEGAGEEGEGGNTTAAAAANKTATVVKTILVPKRKTFQVGCGAGALLGMVGERPAACRQRQLGA
jgi:hypothetical protein